ncbi:MAG: anti-sigma factor [Chloroflexi bacterium]|nr:anti-sigma factor [Chloroflexota bacterium]
MDHAEAHERLADLALDPVRLAGLDHDPASDAAALRRHLASCKECAAELESLRATDSAIRDALAAGGEAGPPAILRPPASLRDRVLAAARASHPSAGVALESVRREPVAAGQNARRWLSLALAAALVGAIGLGSTLGQRIADLNVARDELTEMTDVVEVLDRILAAERHVTVALETADGSPGGVIAWSREEVVVLSTSLDRPPAGREYACWFEEDGKRWKVGSMLFSGSTAYWAGPLDDWNASFDPGTRFGVSLSPQAGGDPLPVLVAEF